MTLIQKLFRTNKYIIFAPLFIIVVLFSNYNNSIAQMGVMPPMLFLDAPSRSGFVSLINNSAQMKEVEVFFEFGYSLYDSDGELRYVKDDPDMSVKYSLEPYIKAFPKKIVVQPRLQQVVRFLVKNIQDKPDGTYFVRLVVKARDREAQIDTTNLPKDKISASFKIITQVNTLIFFQKGNVNAEVNITDLKVTTDAEKVNLLVKMEKTGNSPFFGNIIAGIYDKDGEPVESYSNRIGMFGDETRKLSFDKDRFKPGNYTVEFTINNEHPDVPEKNRTKFKTLNKTMKFTVQD